MFGEEGHRSDGQNFIAEWEQQANLTFISTRQELENYQDDGNNLIGLFAHKHLEYDLERPDDQPSVSQMAKVAINKLKNNPNGFYLFVEGGQIDFGHHGNEAIAALYEFKEFDNTVGTVKDLVDTKDTLVMVSADHGHVFTIGAYGERGTSVFGTGERSSYQHRWSRNGTDTENTFILGYANGPGYRSRYVQNPDNETEWRCGRELPSENEHARLNEPEQHPELPWPATVPVNSESHSAEDVALMASGPWAHLVSGVQEQNFVGVLGEFAMCVGDYQTEAHCSDSSVLEMAISLSLLMILFFNLAY